MQNTLYLYYTIYTFGSSSKASQYQKFKFIWYHNYPIYFFVITMKKLIKII